MQIMHLTQVHYSNSNKVSKEWHCLANATISRACFIDRNIYDSKEEIYRIKIQRWTNQ